MIDPWVWDDGYTTEAWSWFQALFALDCSRVHPYLRARAFQQAATAAHLAANGQGAQPLTEESISLLAEVEDRAQAATLAIHAGRLLRQQHEYGRAVTLLERALALFEALGDQRGVAETLLSLGHVARELGDANHATWFLEASLRLYREQRDKLGTAWSLYGLAVTAWTMHELERARDLLDECLQLVQEVGSPRFGHEVLSTLAWVLRDQGDLSGAEQALGEVLRACQAKATHMAVAPKALEAMAGVVGAQGEPERAARLFGGAHGYRKRVGFVEWPALRRRHEVEIALIADALGPERFSQAWGEGEAMSLEETVAYSLGPDPTPDLGALV